MKIKKIALGSLRVPLKAPFITALRTVSEVDDILIRIETDDGILGFGEAPPTAVITGDTKESIEAAVRGFIAPAVIGKDLSDFENIMNSVQSCMVHNTSAKAAVDMALYDIFAKSCRMPLYRLLGGSKSEFENDITISINSVGQMVRDSVSAVSEGFNILKIKTGTGGLEDIHKVASIREAVGDKIALRVDANQGWDAKTAVRIITEMEQLGLNIELVEQPVRGDDFAGLLYVTNSVMTPVMADESVYSPQDALRILESGAADIINIKLMKSGGIYNALKICSIAESYGIKCMTGCMLEGKVSAGAAAHFAAGKPNVTMADIDAPVLCAYDPFEGGPVFDGPRVIMSEGYGIGIDDIKTDWHYL